MKRLFCISLSLICLCTLFLANASESESINDMKSAKLKAIRGQILSKLGLTSAPSLTPEQVAAIRIPEDIKKVFNVSQEMAEKKTFEMKNKLAKESAMYYAQTVYTTTVKEDKAHPCNSWWNKWYPTSLFYSVNMSEVSRLVLSDPDYGRVVSAKLRLCQVDPDSSVVLSPDPEQLLEVYQIKSCSRGLQKTNYMSTNCVKKSARDYVEFDVTKAVERWIEDPSTNHGIEVTVHPGKRSPYTGGFFSSNTLEVSFSEDGSDRPQLIIMFQRAEQPTQNEKRRRRDMHCAPISNPPLTPVNPPIKGKRRKRQSLAEADSSCCSLTPLYIDFHRDLGYYWIIEPKGYWANECAGECPNFLESDVEHGQILSLYYSVNPAASASPCCVSKAYEPIDVLYVTDNGKLKVKEMTDMIAAECTCR